MSTDDTEASSEDVATSVESDEPVLELDDIVVHFEEQESLVQQALPKSLAERFGMSEPPIQAVDGVSLEIEEEDVVVLVGESGSGKSTLGRTAVGLEEPTEGTVRYRGHDIEDVRSGTHGDEDMMWEDVRRALQIIHQDSTAALNPYRTIRAILSEPLKLWYPELDMNDRYERLTAMLRTVGITPAEEYLDRYPHQLSGGEKQRIAIIRAMLVEPDVILADEVVSALDVSLRIDIMDLLLDLQDMVDTSYLFISHNLTNARYFAEKADGRIAVMYMGNIVEIGPAAEVIDNPKHPYTRILKWASLPLDPDEIDVMEESPMMTDEAPDPSNPPSGCRFHKACPKATEACTEAEPELYATDGDGHAAACYRELPDHEYWESEWLHGEEHDIPE
ncbi:MAG: oligopeptide/dipeptide ABC transporter ATP-binding protein [Halobacteriaceae archaeon]